MVSLMCFLVSATRRYENDNRKSQYNNSSQRRYDNNNNGQGGRTNRGKSTRLITLVFEMISS